MNLLSEAMNGLGAALLQLVGLLPFEELTFGGLVRLLLARRPETDWESTCSNCPSAPNDGRALICTGTGEDDIVPVITVMQVCTHEGSRGCYFRTPMWPLFC